MREKGDVHTGFWWGNLRVEPLGRPRCRWKDNINMDLQKWEGEHGLDSSGSGQGQVVGLCKRGNEPLGSTQCVKFLD